MNRKSSAVALLAAVFFAGVAGTLAVLRVVEHRDVAGVGPPRRTAQHMTATLGLSDDQRTRIEQAMARRREAADEAMSRVLPALRSQMDSLNAEIEAILDDEQRAAFRDYLRDDRERFRRRGRWLPPGIGGRAR